MKWALQFPPFHTKKKRWHRVQEIGKAKWEEAAQGYEPRHRQPALFSWPPHWSLYIDWLGLKPPCSFKTWLNMIRLTLGLLNGANAGTFPDQWNQNLCRGKPGIAMFLKCPRRCWCAARTEDNCAKMSGGSICPPFAFLLRRWEEASLKAVLHTLGRAPETGTWCFPQGPRSKGAGLRSRQNELNQRHGLYGDNGPPVWLWDLVDCPLYPRCTLLCLFGIYSCSVRSTLMYHTHLNWLPWPSDKPSFLNCVPFCVMVHGLQSPGEIAWPASQGRICVRPTSRRNCGGHCNDETAGLQGTLRPFEKSSCLL